MIYKITYTEKLVHNFDIEADTAEEAEAIYNEMAANGELDFSYGEVVDTDIKIDKIRV